LIRRFFFYGTLIAGHPNPVARAVHARLRPLGPATIQGNLYAIGDPAGWYPALLLGAGRVEGQVYETLPEFAEVDLVQLDAYEGADYSRRTVRIEPFGDVQLYFWATPLPAGSEPVPGGNFAEWLLATGRKAWSG
jgi:gamma-glutamylcyclotransferase (GGCT)/AIG2-like uncharacterized protein YtfP